MNYHPQDGPGNWRLKFEKAGLDPERCTCVKCFDQQGCPYAYDFYNYGGDCLYDSLLAGDRSRKSVESEVKIENTIGNY